MPLQAFEQFEVADLLPLRVCDRVDVGHFQFLVKFVVPGPINKVTPRGGKAVFVVRCIRAAVRVAEPLGGLISAGSGPRLPPLARRQTMEGEGSYVLRISGASLPTFEVMFPCVRPSKETSRTL
jgi:hypothetical protein